MLDVERPSEDKYSWVAQGQQAAMKEDWQDQRL